MLRILGLCTIGFFTVGASASVAKFDPPDLNLEFKLHQQYLKGLGKGETTETQTGVVESYQLQNGENLWGLSQMLYGDGNYWPKIWAQNRSISNPHLIKPGHTLQFLLGSEDSAPAFRFSEAEEGGVELAAAVTNNPQIDLPPPEIPSRPIIGIPNSFPPWQDVYRKRPDKMSVDDSRMDVHRKHHNDRLFLSAFVQETELVPSGTFLEPEKESGLPVVNQYVYVKMLKGTAHPGDKYLIVKDHGRIKKLNDQVEGKIEARFVQVYGDLVLGDLAQPNFRRSSDREHFEIFRAMILHTVNLTLTDYDLIPGEMQSVEMTRTGESGTINAQVIGSMKHQASAIYGQGDVVFVNKGSSQGLAVGQLFDIYIDRSIRDDETQVTFSQRPSGMMKLAKVTQNYATGVILSGVDSIQQGDQIRPHVEGSDVDRDASRSYFGAPESMRDEYTPFGHSTGSGRKTNGPHSGGGKHR